MLGVARRKSFRRKTRIFDQSLHYGIRHVRGGRRRPEIHGLESLEHAPGVGRAASYPATFRLVPTRNVTWRTVDRASIARVAERSIPPSCRHRPIHAARPGAEHDMPNLFSKLLALARNWE